MVTLSVKRCGGVVVVVLLLAAATAPVCEAKAQATRQLSREELSHKRLNELRQFLADRGADCRGCVEKEHFVDRALKVQGWPLKQQMPPSPKPNNGPQFNVDEMFKAFEAEQERKQQMREALRKQGVELGEEDEQQAKILENLKRMRKLRRQQNKDRQQQHAEAPHEEL